MKITKVIPYKTKKPLSPFRASSKLSTYNFSSHDLDKINEVVDQFIINPDRFHITVYREVCYLMDNGEVGESTPHIQVFDMDYGYVNFAHISFNALDIHNLIDLNLLNETYEQWSKRVTPIIKTYNRFIETIEDWKKISLYKVTNHTFYVIDNAEMKKLFDRVVVERENYRKFALSKMPI
jgi:hypothetical protein